MTLREAEDWLLGLELFGMRFGLDRMHKLMTVLGMPQRRFASIHVVGTNGKSSTARFIAAILERHGLRTGTYTSPHLVSFAERIEVGEQPLDPADFGRAAARARHAAELVDRTAEPDDRVTQFEALTATAYHELARRRVEVAVVEAGLGGRWDATNVLPSRVQVLTSVGLDHTRWLGPTLRDVAEEKLAVVRDHGVLVTGPLPAEAEEVAARVADRRVRVERPTELSLRARGAFQRRNFALAEAACRAFLGELDAGAVHGAAAAVEVPGRLQVTAEAPLVIEDGAHNPAGAEALAEALPEVAASRPLVGVVAVLDDKDAAGMLRPLLPAFERVVFTRCWHPRSLPPATLASLAGQLGGPPSETKPDAHAALARARELAGPGGAVLATGSIYLVADLRRVPGERRAASTL